jgi:hypothetical protein
MGDELGNHGSGFGYIFVAISDKFCPRFYGDHFI